VLTRIEVIKRVDVITINDEEARQLSGEFSCKAAAKIQAMGPKYVVIKKESMELIIFMIKMFFLRQHCH
jgi:sugar/nucleoside kinase (ribokinase family)